MKNPMLAAALAYRKMGFSVIPLKKNKKPYIKWTKYQSNHPSVEEINAWWDSYPNAIIGIVTGKISGIDVIDMDSQEAYDMMNENFLPDACIAPVVKTPRGYHLYFAHQDGLSNAVEFLVKTDFRTTGGYVVCPPSRNGEGKPYSWVDGLKITANPPPAMPGFLKDLLQQFNSSNNNERTTASSSYKDLNTDARAQYKGDAQCGQNVDKMWTLADNVDNVDRVGQSGQCGLHFIKGRRDNDLFSIANALTKGHCSQNLAEDALRILAASCDPPFDQKEIPAKIKSALNRQEGRSRSITGEVQELIDGSFGLISVREICDDLGVRDRENKQYVSKILKRIEKDGRIERINKNGMYRVMDGQLKPVDWIDADPNYIDLWLPLGLSDVAGIQPGNILVFAGIKDSGKSSFMMNIGKENRHRYNVHYFTSEMSASEFRMRAGKFKDISPDQWHNFSLYERVRDFQDVIQSGPGNLNIIDFLEVTDQFWLVSKDMQKIHEKLNGALAVIAIQKDARNPLGRGGTFSLEKARLYVTLDYGSAKIVSCKNWIEDNPLGNPRGYECRYTIVGGAEIRKTKPGWARAGEEK